MTIGVIVADESGMEIDSLYIGRKFDQNEIKTQWVRENVIPVMGEYQEVETERKLLEHFWSFWMKYHENSYCIADVPFPVEYRLFERCVEAETEFRQWDAPYPLLDLSSILYAADIDPLEPRKDLIREKKEMHNALEDVKTSLEIWKEIRAK